MLIRVLVLATFLLFDVGCLQAQVVSGDYEGLLIGVDPSSGTVTGYYENFTGFDQATGKPRFSCIFYLRGSTNGSPPYTIDTWFPADKKREDVITGSLTTAESNGTAVLKIKLPKEHGGCWNVQHFADDDGASFQHDATGKWVAIRVVSAQKAHFRDDADDTKKRKAYAVKGDPIRVYESRPGWVYAGFRTPDGKTTTGWIREAELFPADPPAR